MPFIPLPLLITEFTQLKDVIRLVELPVINQRSGPVASPPAFPPLAVASPLYPSIFIPSVVVGGWLVSLSLFSSLFLAVVPVLVVGVLVLVVVGVSVKWYIDKIVGTNHTFELISKVRSRLSFRRQGFTNFILIISLS